MNTEIKKIKIEDKSILTNLFQLYMYDLSKYVTDNEINKHGLYDYYYIDNYWTDENYIPYFIYYKSKIVGFALVKKMCEKKYTIIEYFVLCKYRRLGIGKKAIYDVFDKYKGSWEITPIAESDQSKDFWENVILKYTSNNFVKDENIKINLITYKFNN